MLVLDFVAACDVLSIVTSVHCEQLQPLNFSLSQGFDFCGSS